MKKKILMLSEADSIFTKEYIKNVLLQDVYYDISVVSVSNQRFKDWYDKNGIKVITTRNPNKLYSRIKGLRTLITLMRIRKTVEANDADYLIIHCPHWIVLKAISNMKIHARLTICYWGSDILRYSTKELRQVTRFVKSADNVVFMTKELRNRFEEVYESDSVYQGEKYIIDFGCSHFDNIDCLKESLDECKKQYFPGIVEKKVITIGYNASPAQQQNKVIDVISLLPHKVKDDIALLVPWTYGGENEEYEKKVRKALDESEIEYKILTEYMDGDEIAKMCKATDIFINSQTTDALSTSVLEQLYSGTVLISPEWLKYSFLDENGIYYAKYNDFKELPGVVSEVIDKLEQLKEKTKNNTNILAKTHSWKVCKREWEKVLNGSE